MPATYDSLATTTLTSAQASVTFSNISQNYTDLVCVVEGYNAVGNNYYSRFTFNSDNASNYAHLAMEGTGTSATQSRLQNATYILLGFGSVPWQTDSNNRNSQITAIMNYSNTTTFKQLLSRANNANKGVNATFGLWRSTNALTSITWFGDTDVGQTYAIGTTFTLYGIKAA